MQQTCKLINFSFQPPVHVFGIEGRYAHALYSAAIKEKKLEAVEKEIKAVQVWLMVSGLIEEFCYNCRLYLGLCFDCHVIVTWYVHLWLTLLCVYWPLVKLTWAFLNMCSVYAICHLVPCLSSILNIYLQSLSYDSTDYWQS
jgi:hypothetical protein